jgi:hypothetical protein
MVHCMNRSLLLTAVLAQLGVATIAPMTASATTFSGNCGAVGLGTYAEPVGYTPSSTPWTYKGRGHCSGSLDGHDVSLAPIRVRLRFQDDLASCISSRGTATGKIRFAGGAGVIRFRARSVYQSMTTTGFSGGTAVGYMSAYTRLSENSTGEPRECASGKLRDFVADWSLQTVTPLID